MKLYTREEFFKLKLPVIFSRYMDGDIEGLYECYEFVGEDADIVIDYRYIDLTGGDIQKMNNEDIDDYCLKMEHIEAKEDFKLDFYSAYRDGLYDNKQLFIVYAEDDINALIQKLNSVLKKKE